MTESNQQNQTTEPKKKISLQDAIKKQLEQKKNQAAGGKGNLNGPKSQQKMKSQQTKKPSNTRRKMGV
ncbi:hypothetical protein ACQCT5_22420 [Sutcliffiella halmapala]|uniref:Uncharacterized protein n=1 Tax=Sutcliffiella tianshenii TaxID=1463404 RepID=A0ABS2P1Z4_9BACI|nr:hypothetical protein [Bacillus tianshenii]MBM7620940.1 hypothetical protein [Bacillus tianshenii]MCA1321412.1 hypothetical protein [Bacillus tianshenii]